MSLFYVTIRNPGARVIGYGTADSLTEATRAALARAEYEVDENSHVRWREFVGVGPEHVVFVDPNEGVTLSRGPVDVRFGDLDTSVIGALEWREVQGFYIQLTDSVSTILDQLISEDN